MAVAPFHNAYRCDASRISRQKPCAGHIVIWSMKSSIIIPRLTLMMRPAPSSVTMQPLLKIIGPTSRLFQSLLLDVLGFLYVGVGYPCGRPGWSSAFSLGTRSASILNARPMTRRFVCSSTDGAGGRVQGHASANKGKVRPSAATSASTGERCGRAMLAPDPLPKDSHLVASSLEHAWELRLEQMDVAEGPRFPAMPPTVVPPPPGTSMVTP